MGSLNLCSFSSSVRFPGSLCVLPLPLSRITSLSCLCCGVCYHCKHFLHWWASLLSVSHLRMGLLSYSYSYARFLASGIQLLHCTTLIGILITLYLDCYMILFFYLNSFFPMYHLYPSDIYLLMLTKIILRSLLRYI